MRKMTIEKISTYTNRGQIAEQSLRYALCGYMGTADNGSFKTGSDIEEFHMSVKTSAFTLGSARLFTADTFDGQIEEFFENCVSECFAYVSLDMVAYIMNPEEFKMFLYDFCVLQRESSKNGGGLKVRMRKESKRTLAWLEKMLEQGLTA